ncbi:hypothetical protein NX059_012067 [Plenodomus lindquistii]|nr:hypothetical protein NX059_012067 [Plenodomus lindquistii]
MNKSSSTVIQNTNTKYGSDTQPASDRYDTVGFPFHHLPAELRNAVYELVAESKDKPAPKGNERNDLILTYSGQDYPTMSHGSSLDLLVLSHTSRQIRAEARPMFLASPGITQFGLSKFLAAFGLRPNGGEADPPHATSKVGVQIAESLDQDHPRDWTYIGTLLPLIRAIKQIPTLSLEFSGRPSVCKILNALVETAKSPQNSLIHSVWEIHITRYTRDGEDSVPGIGIFIGFERQDIRLPNISMTLPHEKLSGYLHTTESQLAEALLRQFTLGTNLPAPPSRDYKNSLRGRVQIDVWWDEASLED